MDEDKLKRRLKNLTADFFQQPAFIRRADLKEINDIRAHLGMLQVDNQLQEVEPLPEPEWVTSSEELEDEETLAKKQQLIVEINFLKRGLGLSKSAFSQWKREQLGNSHPLADYTLDQLKQLRQSLISVANSDNRLNQVISDLKLTKSDLLGRQGEYIGHTTPLERLTQEDKDKLTLALEEELAAVIKSRELSSQYDRGGFKTETLRTLKCNYCKKPFPTELPPRDANTPGTFHGWLPEEVPWVSGGLILLLNEKRIAEVYHGYTGRRSSCLYKANHFDEIRM